MRIVLLGPPGAGKGTQAVCLAREFSLPHVSTGEYFRKIMAERTELGIVADGYIAKGLLVPDEIVVKIAADRLSQADCSNGFILDGFPRTLAQAAELDKLYRIDHCINIEVESESLIARILGRRVCHKCGRNYHIDFYQSDACVCGGDLIRREDDTEVTVRARIRVYEETTKQLIDYYGKQGKLRTVDGSKPIATVFTAIKTALKT